jgi:hypothetical protein
MSGTNNAQSTLSYSDMTDEELEKIGFYREKIASVTHYTRIKAGEALNSLKTPEIYFELFLKALDPNRNWSKDKKDKYKKRFIQYWNSKIQSKDSITLEELKSDKGNPFGGDATKIFFALLKDNEDEYNNLSTSRTQRFVLSPGSSANHYAHTDNWYNDQYEE